MARQRVPGLAWLTELALLALWAVELAAIGSESLGEEAVWSSGKK